MSFIAMKLITLYVVHKIFISHLFYINFNSKNCVNVIFFLRMIYVYIRDTIDNEGRTVLSVAAAQGGTDVVKQLLARGTL